MHIPAGHWADYPSHRHTCLGEGAVNAVHYYRFQSEAGWGLQRLYLPDGSLDEAVTVRNGDAVIVRQSAHPVVASPGSAMYTLNFLACVQPSWEVEVLPPGLAPGNE
jgi:5-deoxy-glucuronate isomerase